ncbi:SMI1/KNR4 family protein [Streptomyces antibioticus]|uniref:Cell wall assembly protein n=1 Tax=Streptomyces antibioticus TaxID=1890 RepID=A0AAE6YBB2_STRAT|nr:SMI1/KNR4 family protein [Streptomyces antibioticus]OOQ50256.1 cell wall assembly protein [Streptomyces antibioticus]QIT45677.1 SMI1/KNR4 family protein [Streptomyces antibioticus]
MIDGTRTWTDVRRRVTELGARPASGEVFGAHGHGWELADPLTEAQLTDLETQLGVRLPEEYRSFLREVGAGGVGPAYGLFPVRRVDGRWRWEGDGADLADLTLLSHPFPEHGPDPETVAALLAERPDEEEYADRDDLDAFDDAYEAWEERWYEGPLFAPERTAGAIPICHLGCAQREWLVVTGVHRGTVWSDPRADDLDLEPLHTTFADWYLDWLEKAETETGESAASTRR